MSEDKPQETSSTPGTTPATSTPPKYSRYRSVRRAAHADPEFPPPIETKKDDNGPTRSMSRYRRSRIVPKTDPLVQSPSLPPVPQVPKMLHTQSVRADSRPANVGREVVRRVTDPIQGQQGHSRGRETESERAKRKQKERQLKQEQEKAAAREVAAEAQRLAEAGDEAKRILEEQKKKDLERLEAELEAAASGPRIASPREKLNVFARMRSLTKTTPPPTGTSSESDISSLPRARTKEIEPTNGNGPPRTLELPRMPPLPTSLSVKTAEKPVELPKHIEQGGGGIVPQTDAPVSASNAGERRVLIRCKQSSINLPINPETTPIELIYSAANIMTHNISVSTAILLESYTQLGLERRIRRYEHVRDIMNSWDRDTQNALVLQNSDSPNFDHDLEASSVPKEAPADFRVYMYHSQKPGKWIKRHITLQSTGQIYVSKKAGAKPSDKDVANICHLSDFDIYTPTPQQIRKNLKPPKKYCHAIKSQQKTTMFLSTENFVHFFCTDDTDLSEKWYDAVQRWRSWYLVNRLGEGRKTVGGVTIKKLTTEIPAPGRPGTKAGHTVKVSVDENPYTIGSFQPLMDMERFGSPSKDLEYDSEEENRPRQIPFHLRNSVAMTGPSRRESKRHPPPVNYKLPPEAEEEFASSSLLGRTYTQRRMQSEREKAMNSLSGPFVEGPSLLNGHQRTLSVKSTKRPETSAGTGLQRGTSQRQKPKPLLDFTPTFKEAPQWDKTGKGHGVKPIEGVPLIEVATGPNETQPLDGMPQTVFRRDQRPATAGPGREQDGAFVKGGLVSGL